MPTLFPPNRIAVPVFMLSYSIFISAQERPNAAAEAKAQPSRQELDQPTPVDIAPEPTDPTERAIRTIRNRLHNDSLPAPNPDCTPAARNRAKNDGCVVLRTLEELPESVPSKITYVDLPPFGTQPIL